jgi:hypothetical protein
MLMRSLDFGLVSSDAEVAGHCLEGLYALAAWDVSRRAEGHPGLSKRSAPGVAAVAELPPVELRAAVPCTATSVPGSGEYHGRSQCQLPCGGQVAADAACP